jgi:hypothetical protein
METAKSANEVLRSWKTKASLKAVLERISRPEVLTELLVITRNIAKPIALNPSDLNGLKYYELVELQC